MFWLLEAIFRLCKIELEERDIIHVLYPSLPALCCVTWRWPLVAKTCSYYVDLLDTFSCVIDCSFLLLSSQVLLRLIFLLLIFVIIINLWFGDNGSTWHLMATWRVWQRLWYCSMQLWLAYPKAQQRSTTSWLHSSWMVMVRRHLKPKCVSLLSYLPIMRDSFTL